MNGERDWDFCDQCIFYTTCKKPEKKKGDGCETFNPYPYKQNLTYTKPANVKVVIRGGKKA